MDFIELNLEKILERLNRLSLETKPQWGNLSAQGMIEHLTDSIDLALGNHNYRLAIPEEIVPKAQRFIDSEHPMPKNFQVEFTTPETQLRCHSISESIEEFKKKWDEYHAFFNDTRPAYNEEAAKDAWGKVLTFFKSNIQ